MMENVPIAFVMLLCIDTYVVMQNHSQLLYRSPYPLDQYLVTPLLLLTVPDLTLDTDC